MAGIVGIIHKEGVINKSQKNLFNRMYNSIRHEKWYKIDKYVDGKFAIARVHLGIINSETQPIFNENKNLCIFMDGEIFDYEREMQKLILNGHKFKIKNDAEFCLHFYEEFGEKSFYKLNGSYVIIIVDIKNKMVLIVNDRYGLRPIYYAKRNGKLIFASEVKAFLEDASFKRDLNEDSIAEFLNFGQLLGNKTFFREIVLLPPASVLEWKHGKVFVKKYYEFGNFKTTNLSDEKYSEIALSLFKDATKRMSNKNDNLAVALTGGLDSRLVLGSFENDIVNQVETFTFVFDGMDATPKIAKKIAKICNVENVQLKLTPEIFLKYLKRGIFLTDGMNPIYDNINMLPLIDKLEGKILINGFLMDAIFGGGYIKKNYFETNNIESFKKMMYKEVSLPSEQLVKLLNRDIIDKAHKSFNSEFEKYIKNFQSRASSALYFKIENRGRRRIGSILIAIRWRAEFRNPSYDYNFMDFVMSIPKEKLMDRKIQIKSIKKLNPDLAKIKNNHTNMSADASNFTKFVASMITNKYAKFKKFLEFNTHGKISIPGGSDYPDYGKWFRETKELKNFVMKILLDEKTIKRKYFNGKFIVKMINDHMNYKKDYTQLICILLTFELWYRIFIEGESIRD